MGEPKRYQAPADWMASAVAALAGKGVTVVGPVETEPGEVNFAVITDPAALATGAVLTAGPLKRLFFPITEVLLEYETSGDGDVDLRAEPVPPAEEPVVVLGARPCDVAAVGAMDQVFNWDYQDVRYDARRDRTTLVSLACTDPGDECFCTSVGGSPHDRRQADVIAFQTPDGALLEVCTPKGQTFINQLGDLASPAPDSAAPPAPPELAARFDPAKAKTWMDENFQSDFWTDVSLRCLGCGGCTYQCPTCHCFDIVDESEWSRGQRRRNWDCCSYSQFTLHASGHNPRPDQASRCRQRLMHKFKYFPERFDRIACVGCGRCIRTCSVGQDLRSILTAIEAQ